MRVTENTEYEVIEPGTYPAMVLEWTDVDQFGKPLMSKGFADREPAPQWKIKFALNLEGEYSFLNDKAEVLEGVRILSKWVNKPKGYPETVHPKATIVELARAILGESADTTDWDVPDLVEGKCRAQVEVYDKSDGSQGNSIGKFYPPAKKRQAAAPPPEDEDEAPAPRAPAREPVGAGARKPAPF